MITDIKAFQVIRKNWSYGQGKKTKLFNDFNQYDCLGFFLKTSGFSDKDILNADEPIDLAKTHEWFTALLDWSGSICYQTPVCEQIICINDDPNLSLITREQQLYNLFKSINVNVTFID